MNVLKIFKLYSVKPVLYIVHYMQQLLLNSLILYMVHRLFSQSTHPIRINNMYLVFHMCSIYVNNMSSLVTSLY